MAQLNHWSATFFFKYKVNQKLFNITLKNNYLVNERITDRNTLLYTIHFYTDKT